MTTLGTQFIPVHRARDQASALRALVEAQHQRAPAVAPPARGRSAPVIAVTSGKGGVGKTNLCVNLCIAFAKSGIRATLVDADLGMANADVMCGLTPSHRLERVVGLAGPASESSDRARSTLRQIAIDAPGGFRLVPGSVGIAHMAGLDEHDRAALIDGVGELDRDSDVVVIDTGAGVSPGVTSFVQAADLAVVVVTPEPTSIADAYAMIKVLRRGPNSGALSDNAEIGLVVNQALDGAEAHAVYTRISSVAQRFLGFAPSLLGWVPVDTALPRAVRARRPLLLAEPRAPASLAISQVAGVLTKRLDLRSGQVAPRRTGLVHAVAAWLSRSDTSERSGRAGATS